MRKHRIKLNIKSDKELNKLIPCCICGEMEMYRNLLFYVDESNISITNNSKGRCLKCTKIIKRKC